MIEEWLPSGSGSSNGVGPHGPPPSTRDAASGGGLATTVGGDFTRFVPSLRMAPGSHVEQLGLDLQFDPLVRRPAGVADVDPPSVDVPAVRLAVELALHPGLHGGNVRALERGEHVRGRAVESRLGGALVAGHARGHRAHAAAAGAERAHVPRRLLGRVATLLAVRRTGVALGLEYGLEVGLAGVELLARNLE